MRKISDKMEKKLIVLKHYGKDTYLAIRIVMESLNIEPLAARKLLGTSPIELYLTDQQIAELKSNGAIFLEENSNNKQETPEIIEEDEHMYTCTYYKEIIFESQYNNIADGRYYLMKIQPIVVVKYIDQNSNCTEDTKNETYSKGKKNKEITGLKSKGAVFINENSNTKKETPDNNEGVERRNTERIINSSLFNNEPNTYSYPTEVQPRALIEYTDEKCICFQDIIDTAKEIINANKSDVTGEVGWILCKKRDVYCDPNDHVNYEREYVLVLDSAGKWKRYHSKSLYTNEPYSLDCAYNNENFNDLLLEFDFSGYYNFDSHRGNLILFLRNEYASITNAKNESGYSFSLTRNYEKGQGLLQRLIRIKETREKTQLITKPYAEQIEIEDSSNKCLWKKQDKCQYCGGLFKGLFIKKCSNCGHVKDY